MIIWWRSGGSVVEVSGTVCDFPLESQVKSGVVFDNGSKTGTYTAGITTVNPSAVGLPDVGGAMNEWFQNMVFRILTKTVEDFQVVEAEEDVNFRGVMQPYTPQQLMIRPEGQRAWKWHMLHATPNLALKNDDIVVYQSAKYRVKDKTDYTMYGYIEYHLVEDYE